MLRPGEPPRQYRILNSDVLSFEVLGVSCGASCVAITNYPWRLRIQPPRSGLLLDADLYVGLGLLDDRRISLRGIGLADSRAKLQIIGILHRTL